MSDHQWIESSICHPERTPQLWDTERLLLGGREFRLVHPREPDRLLDDVAVAARSRADDYMPYWAYLWPAAPALAEVLLGESWLPGTRALELGCGLGLAGLAALACGMHVTFSDYSPAALAVAAHNASANGFTEFATQLIDWREPPVVQFPLVLGADVLYEKRCLAQILNVLEIVMAPGGMALLTDPFRLNAEPFAELAVQRGFAVTTRSHASRQASAVRVYRLARV